MKKLLIISLFLFIGGYGYGQKDTIMVNYYESELVSAQQLIYINGDTLNPYEHYYPNRNQIKSKGTYLKKGLVWSNIGLREEWYITGQKKMETFKTRNKYKAKYVNMWAEDGTQIMKNGKGFYYIKHSLPFSDSTVIQVKDSVLVEDYLRYKRDTLQSFYLYEKTTYDNNGAYELYYPSGEIMESGNYKISHKQGVVIGFHKNGVTKSNGHYVNNQKNGDWSYWDSDENLLLTESYKKGKVHGNYTEYYADGKIKITGKFIHIIGEAISSQYDEYGDIMEGFGTIETITPRRDGYWFYYDENGNKIKSIFHQDGVKYIYDNKN